MLDEDTQRFLEIVGLDHPIPSDGLQEPVTGAWNGEDPVVLWENLGTENGRMRSDGSPNTLLQKLDTWEPEVPIRHDSINWWDLRLTLQPDHTLQLAAVGPDQKLVQFRPRGGLS